MNTNHNRIKVADLETNQPNKILITNEIGELEFGNLSSGEGIQDLQSVIDSGSSATLSTDTTITLEDEDTSDSIKISGRNIRMYNNSSDEGMYLSAESLTFTNSDDSVDFDNTGSITYKNDNEGFIKLSLGDNYFSDNNIIVKVPSNLPSGEYTLATTDDLPNTDDFVHKNGEVNEIIDGFKTFRFPIRCRGDASAAYTTVQSGEICFTVDANDNSSITLKPNRVNFDEDENYTQELQAKNGTIALLSDINIIEEDVVHKSGDENIAGSKRFIDSITIGDPNSESSSTISSTELKFKQLDGSSSAILKPTPYLDGHKSYILPDEDGTLATTNDIVNMVNKNVVRKTGNETVNGFKTFTSNCSVNEIYIGKGPSNIESNTIIGQNSFLYNSTGNQNTAVGYYALCSNTTGEKNIAISAFALQQNTEGEANIAIGSYSLFKNTTGVKNIAMGDRTMELNITGSYNLAVGSKALYDNISGQRNVSLGANTSSGLISSADNVYVGYSAGSGNGINNVAIGSETLGEISAGSDNTAIGRQANQKNTSGSQNTSIGAKSLIYNTIGLRNTAIGTQSLYQNLTGSNNIAIGYDAGRYLIPGIQGTNSGGNYSIFIGVKTSAATSADTNQIVIGYNATGLGSNTTTIGNSSITTTRLRGEIQGGSFKKDGGISSQFLKADGSVDTKTYLTSINFKTIGGNSIVGSGNITEVQNSLNDSTIFAASVTALNGGLALKANLASPNFIGLPKVPTAAIGDNSMTIANTEFVTSAVTKENAENVKITGNQEIEGFKRFNNYLILNGLDSTDEISITNLDTFPRPPETTIIMAKDGTINAKSFINSTLPDSNVLLAGGSGSQIFDDGNRVIIGSTDNGTDKLQVAGTIASTGFKLNALNTAPLLSSSTGTTGEIRYTSNYIYVCTGTNTWVRTPLTTW